jgi:hypothetical protein
MTEKSGRKVFEKKTPTNNSLLNVKRGRGRPKGSKNKPKTDNVIVVAAKRRGRPKGSKNKVKDNVYQDVKIKGKYTKSVSQDKVEIAYIPKPPGKRGRPKKIDNTRAEPTHAAEGQKSDAQRVPEGHPLLAAIAWLEKNMHHNELQYYRSRANKLGATVQVAIASDIMGFFNVQDHELCKQIKKNTFIANTTRHELH